MCHWQSDCNRYNVLTTSRRRALSTMSL